MTTTVYLDVDGVLNAVSRRTPSVKITGWDDWTIKRVGRWPIHHSPAMISELNALAARDDVTFKWVTTWEDSAAKELSPAIGINGQGWEVLRGDQHAWHGQDWWKLKAVRDDVDASSGSFIWIDDDISAERHAIEWAQSRDDVLILSPSSTQALTREDLNFAKSFISAALAVTA
ncbi:hydrolase [Arthrobacter phage TripleJ]|uniref:Hydrolase n=1 Tax=Arthrobacter phage TripleJ TaxID=2599838 RepID=A0A5J6TGV9_9CAUD|nr:hydrolase [Arthrobacter phage TripleJ]QFG09588.1 hydrolase [Arthrobacter phage TripleJ]